MIDPSKTTPRAPLALRVGSKGFARAQRAAMAGSPSPAAETDDDEDEEDDEDEASSKNPGAAIADHEPVRAAAEEAHAKAAEAYKASKGTDSAAALMHAEDMGDAASDAHEKAKASSMALRGAAPDGQAPADPAKPAPPAAPAGRLPVVSLARAIAATGGTAESQAKIAATIAFADRMSALFGGASLDQVEGRARAAHADAAEALTLRAAAETQKKKNAKRAEADADAALRAKLAGAVRAQKYARAELFDVTESVDVAGNAVEVLTPQAWTRAMAPAALDAMLAAKQARASGPPLVPDETPVGISAAVQAYGRARGWPDGDPRYAQMMAALPATTGATAPQETR